MQVASTRHSTTFRVGLRFRSTKATAILPSGGIRTAGVIRPLKIERERFVVVECIPPTTEYLGSKGSLRAYPIKPNHGYHNLRI
jgi:hypothetical protein